jgi:23S rRNA (adenine2030-N6)-methyltransferase
VNYRHAFHAGNIADVFKHSILTRLVEYLKRKEPAFRVFDTHAGAGSYDLMSEEARRGNEWQDGIDRLFKAPLSDMSRQLLAPYMAACGLNPSTGTVRTYPGSPRLIRSLIRKQDRLSAYELHEDEYAQLAHLLAGDFQARATRLDGWLVAGAHLPPKEKRGLLFIDPPFETSDDFARIFDTLTKAHQRWAGGMVAAWYPVKDKSMVDTFRILVSDTGPPDVIDVRFSVAEAREDSDLVACGMLVKNPPFLLEPELRVLLPELVRVLGRDGAAGYSIERLTEE